MPLNGRSDLYWAYGLTIASEVALGDLLPSDDPKADVVIAYGKLTDSVIAERLNDAEVFERPGCRVLVSEDAVCVDWERVGRILIRTGSDVMVEPAINVIEEDLQPFLTGPVLAFVLHQLDRFVLHASAVIIDGVALVFLGSKGDGKSTLAAHLQVRGHQLISDDLVPVSFDGTMAVTYPGFPRIKLYEDAISAVGEQPERFPLIHRFVEKRSFRYSEKFPKEAVQIGGVYVLSESEEIGLEPLNPATAFIELTKHSFLNRFLNAMNSRREHFQHCDQLVRSIPIMRLCRPHDFAAMNDVCTVLEEHAGGIIAGQAN